jgi:hypothetical protein
MTQDHYTHYTHLWSTWFRSHWNDRTASKASILQCLTHLLAHLEKNDIAIQNCGV